MSKYQSLLSNTIQTIAYDMEEVAVINGENLTIEMLADASLDYVSIHGGDEELATEFSNLPYEEQIKIAKSVTELYW